MSLVGKIEMCFGFFFFLWRNLLLLFFLLSLVKNKEPSFSEVLIFKWFRQLLSVDLMTKQKEAGSHRCLNLLLLLLLLCFLIFARKVVFFSFKNFYSFPFFLDEIFFFFFFWRGFHRSNHG